jgi:hypothetical protein
MSRQAARPEHRHAASTAHARRAAVPPRRVSGPSVRAGAGAVAVALPAPRRRGATGTFERVLRLPDHRMADRLLRGRAWIWLVGILLGGIVAMQVSLLKLNAGISRAVEASATLERQNSALESSIARLSSGERIRDGAERSGMIMPPAGEVQYVTVRPDRDAARAVARMRPPSDAAHTLMANRGVIPGSLPAAALGDGAAGTAPVTATTNGTTPASTISTAASTGTTGGGAATGAAAPPQTTAGGGAATGATAPPQTTAGAGAPTGAATTPQTTTTAGGGTAAGAATPPQTTTAAGGTAPQG